jgi:hypothetical protein
MWPQVDLLDFECDTPPYAIVQACAGVGLRTPEDVRWCRLADLPSLSPAAPVCRGTGRPGIRRCPCGEAFPLLNRCTFDFNTGRQVSYVLGQCRRCRTIYWDDARSHEPHMTESSSRS